MNKPIELCTTCKGRGKHPLVNVWKISEDIAQGQEDLLAPDSRAAYLLEDAPCPDCRREDFWGFVGALVEKRGEPLEDEPVLLATIWSTPDGKTATVLRPEFTEEEADKD